MAFDSVLSHQSLCYGKVWPFWLHQTLHVYQPAFISHKQLYEASHQLLSHLFSTQHLANLAVEYQQRLWAMCCAYFDDVSHECLS